jgi:hypothetical protein
MKRFIFPVIILCAALFVVIGCSNEKAIEDAIGDWTNAINKGDVAALTDVVSSDSDWYEPLLIENVIAINFNGLIPISYHIVDIDVDNPYADVPSTADYLGYPNINAKFVMKKESGFLSFLSPKWKVFQCWSDLDSDGFQVGVDEDWRRIKK